MSRSSTTRCPTTTANDGQPGPETSQAQDMQVPTTAGISSVSDDDRRLRPGRPEQHRQLAADSGHQVLLLDRPAGRRHRSGEQHQRLGVDRQPRRARPPHRPTTATSAIRTSRSLADPTLDELHGAGCHGQLRRPDACRPTRVRASTTTATPAERSTTRAPTARSRRRRSARWRSAPRQPPPAKGADLTITDASAYKASGTVELTVGGKLAGTAKFSLQPKAQGHASRWC